MMLRMEVGTAIPQLAWNGHTKHTPNDTHHLHGTHSALISGEYDGMTSSDNSDSPPLPTTPPPDYFNNPSSLQSDHESHTGNVEFTASSQDRACHSDTTVETVTQAKALSDGDSSDDDDDDELGVLEQLKSCSATKLMQLQQVQVMKDNTIGSNERQPRSVHVSSEDNNSQAEILRLRKVRFSKQ